MKLLLITAAAVLSATSAFASVVTAYDDAADPIYNSGWAGGSNGGYGFGPWLHSPFGIYAMGDSNLNGTLGGPGINVGGRAWQGNMQPNSGGAVAGRSLGGYTIGDSFEIDVDFGIAGNQGVALLGNSDYCQVQATSSSSTLVLNTGSGTFATTVGYSDGGYRIRYDLLSASAVDITITSFASSLASTYNLAFASVPGATIMTIQADPTAGQAVYASRMRVISPVPEPASLSALALGTLLVARRRRKS